MVVSRSLRALSYFLRPFVAPLRYKTMVDIKLYSDVSVSWLTVQSTFVCFGYMLGGGTRDRMPSQLWLRAALAVTIAMNLGFASVVHRSSEPLRWGSVFIGWIFWNLLPATLIGIAAVLRKQGR